MRVRLASGSQAATSGATDVQEGVVVRDFGGRLDPGQPTADHHDARSPGQLPQARAQRLGAVEVGDVPGVLGPGQAVGGRAAHGVQQVVEGERAAVVEAYRPLGDRLHGGHPEPHVAVEQTAQRPYRVRRTRRVLVQPDAFHEVRPGIDHRHSHVRTPRRRQPVRGHHARVARADHHHPCHRTHLRFRSSSHEGDPVAPAIVTASECDADHGGVGAGWARVRRCCPGARDRLSGAADRTRAVLGPVGCACGQVRRTAAMATAPIAQATAAPR